MIKIDNLSFGYGRGHKLFDGLDLTLEPGTVYGLFGKNGAGKTTLLKLIQGLIYPHEGEITVYGHQPRERALDFLANSFFLAEEPYLPKVSMKRFISTYASFYPRFDLTRFFQLLNEFDIDREMHLGKASMGQKKKALIAFAIAANTDLLIMDEPTNGLDIPSKRQFRKIMAHIMTDDRTFIISTHQVRDLHSIIDNVTVLDKGKVIFNERLGSIADQLSFVIRREPPVDENVLYYERVPGGYLCILSGGSDLSLEVDIETLFNAITSEKESILSQFKSMPVS